VLEINLRTKNYSTQRDDDQNQTRRRAALSADVEEEEEKENTPFVQTPEKGPVEEIVPDEPVPEEPGPGREKGGVRNIFIFGFLNYLKGLFSPFAQSGFAKETEPAIEYYWYRETAAAGLSEDKRDGSFCPL